DADAGVPFRRRSAVRAVVRRRLLGKPRPRDYWRVQLGYGRYVSLDFQVRGARCQLEVTSEYVRNACEAEPFFQDGHRFWRKHREVQRFPFWLVDFGFREFG